ncbi:hypothetical protein Achl_4323 (plasmid) [Pseudarthrobacter chlorophenolicus A6]|uniref:Uncharacterized protein n=1 Tax=Pseudarthrobacter chlorophenolicus (strain ATCC 700700 / DSM 12829 / CIP 107037 / JCM 12360 / KCTC 9906 / NCIMB 13794 / A6) TaxID=452863 RepID=B8HIM7_PSECP|nr:hypothetical protein [Pseudarthrobacter chlorophenolicus]ACL42274.1 hypothetical protein Achl_4323 [Pseudarthrobacter chlorophenolicus A6]
MNIQIRRIPNDTIVALAAQLNGLHVQTDFTDIKGRLVSGNLQSARPLDDGRIAITLTRYLNGEHVLDGATVPSGNDPLGRPWRTAFHIPEGSGLLPSLEAA